MPTAVARHHLRRRRTHVVLPSTGTSRSSRAPRRATARAGRLRGRQCHRAGAIRRGSSTTRSCIHPGFARPKPSAPIATASLPQAPTAAPPASSLHSTSPLASAIGAPTRRHCHPCLRLPFTSFLPASRLAPLLPGSSQPLSTPPLTNPSCLTLSMTQSLASAPSHRLFSTFLRTLRIDFVPSKRRKR